MLYEKASRFASSGGYKLLMKFEDGLCQDLDERKRRHFYAIRSVFLRKRDRSTSVMFHVIFRHRGQTSLVSPGIAISWMFVFKESRCGILRRRRLLCPAGHEADRPRSRLRKCPRPSTLSTMVSYAGCGKEVPVVDTCVFQVLTGRNPILISCTFHASMAMHCA